MIERVGVFSWMHAQDGEEVSTQIRMINDGEVSMVAEVLGETINHQGETAEMLCVLLNAGVEAMAQKEVLERLEAFVSEGWAIVGNTSSEGIVYWHGYKSGRPDLFESRIGPLVGSMFLADAEELLASWPGAEDITYDLPLSGPLGGEEP